MKSTPPWRIATVLVLTFVPVLLGLWDFAAYHYGGNDATISRTVLDASAWFPFIGYTLAFGAGLIVGHFVIPQHVEVSLPSPPPTGPRE